MEPPPCRGSRGRGGAAPRPFPGPAQAARGPPPPDPPPRRGADAAEGLGADARAGLMRDVDHARITRAWQGVRSGRHSLTTFTGAVLREGAAACPHPSGARDLPGRLARHDLVTGQVRLGTTA